MVRLVIVTSGSYALGTAVVLRSMADRSRIAWSGAKATVITLDDLSASNRRMIESASAYPTEIVPMSDLPAWRFRADILKPHRAINMNKIRVMALPYEGETCWLMDSDLMCCGDMTPMLQVEPFAAGVNMGRMPPRHHNNRVGFNSGFVIYRPSMARFEEMQRFADEFYRDSKRLSLGDQHVWNSFMLNRYPREVQYLDLRWNATSTLAKAYPVAWRDVEPDVRLYHFTQEKPWNSKLADRWMHQWRAIARQVRDC